MAQVVKFKKPKGKLRNYGFNEFFSMLVESTPSFKNASGLHRGPRALEAVRKKEVGKTVELELEDHRDVKATMMADTFQFPSLPFKDDKGNEGFLPASMFMDYMITIRDAEVVDTGSDGPDEETRRKARKARKDKRKGLKK